MVREVEKMDEDQIKKILFAVFLIIFIITCMITFYGIYLSWGKPDVELPYLKYFISAFLGEVGFGIVSLWKDLFGLKKIKTKTFKSDVDVAEYLKNLMKNTNPIDVFSHRLTWITNHPDIREMLIDKAKKFNHEVNIFIPKMNETAKDLNKNKINIYETGYPPSSRFTLTNRGYRGSEKLAVIVRPPSSDSSEIYKIHEFWGTNSQQVIASSEDLVKILLKSIKKSESK
jgi:hypothetical protein